MRQSISILVVIISSISINSYAQNRSIQEEYYTINIDGAVDTLIIKEKRSYSYNLWGDITRDELITSTGDTTVFSYEYYYLPQFTYATNSRGITAISGYKNDYESLWLRRTVKRDNSIVESVNRRVTTHNKSNRLRTHCKIVINNTK